MAKKPAVICLYCNKHFQREEEEFEQIGRRYCHKTCSDKVNELFSLLERKLGEEFSPTKVKNQINKLTKEDYNLEDICDAMYWWYEINNGDATKANGGIGIFSYIYPDFIKYKNKKQINANRNKDKKLEDYVDSTPIEVKIHPTPIKRPKMKLFSFE